MKRTGTIILLLAIVASAVLGIWYIYNKNQEDPVVYKTEEPGNRTIVKETVATGKIVPQDEILIKPNISGIIEEIFVEAGDLIKEGDLIAKIKVVPNPSNLTSSRNGIASARTGVEQAKLDLANQQAIYDRQKALFDKGIISANDFDNVNNAYQQAKQRVRREEINLRGATQTYQIVSTGTTSGLGNAATTDIRSTITGMILEIPVKEGNQVIEANNFNEGTTIASLADVDQMIFEGKVDESEVGKIKEGLPLEITVGAIENAKFDAVLDYIAPKGKDENGAVQFEIKGTLKGADSTRQFIRAGLSANASIILDKVTDELAVKEAVIQYDTETKQPFVEIETGEDTYERRDVELGLSDGIYVQVKNGIAEGDKIKVWNQIAAPGRAY